jgi:hypothetical protein
VVGTAGLAAYGRSMGTGQGTTSFNASFDERPDAYDTLRGRGAMARRWHDRLSVAVRASPGPVVEPGTGSGTLLRDLAARRPDGTFLASNRRPATVPRPCAGGARLAVQRALRGGRS